jgi:hypothetical protein
VSLVPRRPQDAWQLTEENKQNLPLMPPQSYCFITPSDSPQCGYMVLVAGARNAMDDTQSPVPLEVFCNFNRKYGHDSGISSIETTKNSLRVVVKTPAAAAKLPASFQGVSVVVVVKAQYPVQDNDESQLQSRHTFREAIKSNHTITEDQLAQIVYDHCGLRSGFGMETYSLLYCA